MSVCVGNSVHPGLWRRRRGAGPGAPGAPGVTGTVTGVTVAGRVTPASRSESHRDSGPAEARSAGRHARESRTFGLTGPGLPAAPPDPPGSEWQISS